MSNNYIGIRDDEFLIISKAIKSFYKEQITEQEFINIINGTSAKYIKTILPDPNNFKLLKDAQRIKSGNYTVKDVKGFMISYNGKNWHIYIGRDIIETLANDGDEEEIERLASIEAYEESLRKGIHSMPPLPKSLSESDMYLDSIDKYYDNRKEFIEKKQKEIAEKKKKDILRKKR